MDINSRGDFAHGVGGSYANRNNRAFARGGTFGFLDDDTIAFANGDDVFNGLDWAASAFHVPSGVIRRLGDTPSGANHGFAGGGHAAWWWGHFGGGLFSTTGLRLPSAGLLAMGPDAAIAYKPDYQSNGPTRVRELNGDDWILSNGHPYGLRLLGQRRALWPEGAGIQTVGLPRPVCTADGGGPWRPGAAFAGGRWWITYQCGARGIVLHPFDSFEGFSVQATGDGWHDIRAIGPDVIRVLVSVSIAEQAGQIWGLDYNVRTGEVHEITSGTRIPDAERRVDIRTINQDRTIASIGRPMWLGFFEFGPGPLTPGNCSLAVRHLVGLQPRPVIVHDDSVGHVSGLTIGHFIDGSTVEAIEAAAQRVHAAGRPPVAYWDGRRWPRWPSLPPESLLCLQAYCGHGESLVSFEADLRNLCLAAPRGQALALVAQCYTSNATLTTDLASLVPVYARVARDCANIKALLVFSGNGRATGLQDHPEVRPLWEQLAAGVPGTPPIVLVPPPTPTPDPPPDPPTPTPFLPRASAARGSMRVHLKRGNKFIGVDPSTPGVVYADRDTGSEWERVELTKRSDGHFDARFIAANRQLAMTPDGRLETRDAGAVGPWESFYATEQPDGAKFLYQTNGDTVGPVLLMLEA